MKKVNSGIFGLLMSLIEIVIGILLLINPVGFTSGIIITLGVVLTIMGLGQVVQYFRTDAEEAAEGGKLTKGIFLSYSVCFALLSPVGLLPPSRSSPFFTVC